MKCVGVTPSIHGCLVSTPRCWRAAAVPLLPVRSIAASLPCNLDRASSPSSSPGSVGPHQSCSRPPDLVAVVRCCRAGSYPPPRQRPAALVSLCPQDFARPVRLLLPVIDSSTSPCRSHRQAAASRAAVAARAAVTVRLVHARTPSDAGRIRPQWLLG
jgi:hypothetical protein